MRRLATAVCLLASTAACHPRTPPPKAIGQLDNDAAVFVFVEPVPAEARRLTLTVAGVSARGGAAPTPLEVTLPALAGNGKNDQRLLAFGKLAPGSYDGLAIRIAKATVPTEQGTADLLVPEEPVSVDVPFTAAPGKAVVLWVTSRTQPPSGREFELDPAFTGVVPPRPIPELIGLCSSVGWDGVLTFDASRSRVASVLATGRGPQGLALDRLASRIYFALSGDDEIRVVDLLSTETVTRVPLTPGDAPRELALTPDGRLLVAINARSYTVSFIDPVGAVELGRLPVGEEPVSLLMDRSGRRAYVFNRRSNTMTVLDVATRSVVATVSTDAEPLRGAFNRAGDRLYVIQAGSPYLDVFALPDLTRVGRIHVGLGASGLLVDSRSDLVYVAKRDEGRLYVYDPLSLLALTTIEVPYPVTYMVIDDPRNALLALMPERRAVAVVDLTGRRVVSSFDVGDEPYALIAFQQRP